jgi:hypothetical protein
MTAAALGSRFDILKRPTMASPQLYRAKGLLRALFPDEADRPGVPWLRQEVAAGRVPSVKHGRFRLFDLEAVRGALYRRKITPTPTKRR